MPGRTQICAVCALLAAVVAAAAEFTEAEKKRLFELYGFSVADAPVTNSSARSRVPLTPELCEKLAIRESVVLLDPDYDHKWVSGEERIGAFFEGAGMRVLTVPEATEWIRERIRRGADGTSLVMAMGVTPADWLTEPFDKSLVARYLASGGRIAWAGDVPFAFIQDEFGCVGEGRGGFFPGAFRLGGFLGLTVDCSNWLGREGGRSTPYAKAWGLEKDYGTIRPVDNAGVQGAFSVSPDGKLVDGYHVLIRRENPLSGFVCLPGRLDGADEPMLRDLYRIAWWSGREVKVPEVPRSEGARKPELLLGTDVRETFLRGEFVKVAAKLNGLASGQGTLTLKDEDGRVLRSWTGRVKDGDFAFLDLTGLRRGAYRAELQVGGTVLARRLFVAPPVDHEGFAYSLWAEFSPIRRRTRHQLEELKKAGLSVMVSDSFPASRDLCLELGMPFTGRSMPETPAHLVPEGYDDWMRLPDGGVKPLLAAGNRPETRSYDNPWRREEAAERLLEAVRYDAQFPAYDGVSFTADDFSQWFGPSWNRFAAETFRAKYGIDLPKSETDIAAGVVSDDAPALLAAKAWSGIWADYGRRLSVSIARETGGKGRVAPIPGGMQIPMNMWSAMHPYFSFGKDGWSQPCFYYYNGYWQPPLANTYWLAIARSGDRRRRVWMMPDCYIANATSYYDLNLWHLLAGGADGLCYFYQGNMQPAARKTLERGAAMRNRLGLLLGSLVSARARAVFLAPFENAIADPTDWYGAVIPWSNLVYGGIDADPAIAEEDWEGARAVVLLHVRTLTASGKAKLEAFAASGGMVYADAETARTLGLAGAKTLPAELAGTALGDYAPKGLRGILASAMPDAALRPLSVSREGVVYRRFEDALGNPHVWFADTPDGTEFARMNRDTRSFREGGGEANPDHRVFERDYGYGRALENVRVSSAETGGRIAWDVLEGRELPVRDGRFTLPLTRWGGKLVAFLPESPAPFDLSLGASTKPGLRNELLIRTSGRCAVPFTVRAVDPKGVKSEEYRARLLSGASGRTAWPFEFAVNDLKGKWTFAVRNELTREVRSIDIVLK